MPIRFKGSARPRRVKSPDPLNMPSIRENRATRQRTEVDYFDVNDRMPEVVSPFSGTPTIWFEDTVNMINSTSRDVFSVDFGTWGGKEVMAIGQTLSAATSAGSSRVLLYENVNGTWEHRASLNSNSGFGRSVRISASDVGENMLFVGRNNHQVSGQWSAGTVYSYIVDTTTDPLNWTWSPVGFRTSFTSSRNVQYFGQNITVHDGVLLGSAHGYKYLGNSNSSQRTGMVQYVQLNDGKGPIRSDRANASGVFETLEWDGISSTIHNHRTYNYKGVGSWFYGAYMDQDGDTVAIVASGGTNAGYLGVVQVDPVNKTVTTQQYIDHPLLDQGAPTISPGNVAIKDGSLFWQFFGSSPALGNVTSRSSIVEYRENNGQWEQYGWYDLPEGFVFASMTAISRDELLFGSTNNERALFSITRS